MPTLLPLRFVATFLVPALYPSMISTVALFIASLGNPPPGTFEPWILNFFAICGGLLLLASLALTIKKLLGRTPSLDEVLSGLVTTKTLDEYKEEQRLRDKGLEIQISDARHSFDARANSDLKRNLEMFTDVQRRGEQRDTAIAEMERTIARLQERTESHLRKLDSNDTKMDNLLAQVSAATAQLKDAARRADAQNRA